MSGTESQIEWAEQLKRRVDAEFDRVAQALRATASRQAGEDRSDTEAIIGILEEKRAEVMANDRAVYFIRDWGELTNQVRQMLMEDSRYRAIRANRAARSSGLAGPEHTSVST